MREQQGFTYRKNPPRTAYTASVQADEEEIEEEVEEYQPPPRQQRAVQKITTRQPVNYAQPRMATSSRRYDLDEYGYPVPRRARVEYHDTPYHKPAPKPVEKPRRRIHWMAFVGGALFLIAFGYIGLTSLGAWWQNHTDDVTFGTPRTYQTDAVVGHNDSSSNPSHFICQNLHGHISVLEAPGGNWAKAMDYPITTQVGSESAPCTLTFSDLNGDGKLDMVVTVGDPGNSSSFYLFNTGQKFSNKP